MHLTTSLTAAGAIAGLASAAITVDGFVDPDYGLTELVVQDTQTGFGNSDSGQVGFANGSELDGAYGVIQDGALHLMLTGNLESNFNKLEVFLDFGAGGQNRLRGDNPDVDFNGLNRMGDDGTDSGLIFDAGFEADYWITVTGGDTGDGQYHLFASSSEILTDGGGTGGFLGEGIGGGAAGAVIAGNGIIVAIDNSNIAGVDGGDPPGPSDGSGVATGIEILIPLGVLGDPSSDVKVCAFINAGGHDFMSNQTLGASTGAPNLGDPRFVDFGLIGGDQFFTVANSNPPCPSDTDGNGSVDFDDLLAVLSNWGPCSGCAADVDGNGNVDFDDLLTVLSNWGPCP